MKLIMYLAKYQILSLFESKIINFYIFSEFRLEYFLKLILNIKNGFHEKIFFYCALKKILMKKKLLFPKNMLLISKIYARE